VLYPTELRARQRWPDTAGAALSLFIKRGVSIRSACASTRCRMARCLTHLSTRCAAATAEMADIHNCVICEKRLDPERKHVDTCGEPHYRRLLELQRLEANASPK
jgi:hypothetical protein